MITFPVQARPNLRYIAPLQSLLVSPFRGSDEGEGSLAAAKLHQSVSKVYYWTAASGERSN